MRRHDPVVLAWAGGIALAVLVYLVGPTNFVFRVQDALHVFAWRVTEALAQLSAGAFDLVRALAIGLFATFLVLGFAVARRGGRARVAIIVVGLVFVGLVEGAAPGDQGRWLLALLLSGLGAAVMTGRLRQTGLVRG